jgi:hypothetical protein
MLTTSDLVGAINSGLPDIIDANITDLVSLAAQIGLVRLRHQIETDDSRFHPVRMGALDRKDVHKLTVVADDEIHPSRSRMHIMNLNQPLRGLAPAVKLDGAGTPELMILFHHDGDQGTGRNARKMIESLARSTCPENNAPAPRDRCQ